MSDVDVGVQLFDYVDQLAMIMSKLGDASTTAHEAADLLAGEEGFYDGEARGEMKMFYDSYAAHVDKLFQLNFSASQYLQRVVDEFHFTDEELATIIITWADANGYSALAGGSSSSVSGLGGG